MASMPLFDLRDEPAICSVSQLTARIKNVLETDFSDVALVGEVSNLARPRSRHVYLSLKDESAQIKAVIWKSVASRLPFDLADGLSVRVWGELSVYAPRGDYQVSIRRIEPEGIGALELAFRQRFEKLKAEGLFDPDRKRPLPRFPRRIVVVTSPTGAAIRDFLQVTGRRWSATEILIAPAKMQGAGSAQEVARAIELANRVDGADLIVVTRGGGSLEDLWTFNEEVVARAIAGSSLPVVSAIGHEVDVTLADHAADFRALTPSEAGERVVPDAREVRQARTRPHVGRHHDVDVADAEGFAQVPVDELDGGLGLWHRVAQLGVLDLEAGVGLRLDHEDACQPDQSHEQRGRDSRDQCSIVTHPPSGSDRGGLAPGRDRLVRRPPFEVFGQGPGRSVAILNSDRHGLQADRFKRLVDRRVDLARRRKRPILNVAKHSAQIGPRKRRVARQQRIERRPQTVDVRARPEGFEITTDLLGAHVGWRSQNRTWQGRGGTTGRGRHQDPFVASRRGLRFAHRFGQPPVNDQRLAVLADDHVGWFQVAMEDPSAVGIIDGVANVDEPSEQIAERQRLLAWIVVQAPITVVSGNRFLESITLDKAHRIVRSAVGKST